MIRHIVAGVAIAVKIAAAAETYHDFCVNAINGFGSEDAVAFTNYVASYISETSGPARVSSRIVMAIAMYDIFEAEQDNVALDMCTQECTNALNDATCPNAPWQKAAAGIVLSTALATQCMYREAHVVCTNALASYVTPPVLEDDLALWSKICSHHLVSGLDVQRALGFYSAISSIFDGEMSFPPAYTNNLPTQALEKILDVVNL